MKRKVCEFILIMLFYLFQCTLGKSLAIGRITPNFLLVLPILLGYLHGKNEGIYVGLVAGFFYDVFFNSILGFSSLVFMYAGCVSGFYYQKYEKNEMIIPLLLVGISAFSFEFLSYIGNFLLHNKLDIFYYVSRFIVPETVYTIFVTIVLYRPFIFLNEQFNSKDRRRTTNFDERSI